MKNKEKVKILFVCLGNICRSPAAEGVMKEIIEHKGVADRFVVDSAGTGGYHVGDLPDPRMRAHARRRGYNLTHRARQFRPSDFEDFDLIIPMDESNKMNVKRMASTTEHENKIVPMAKFLGSTDHYDYIPDPYYEGSEGFELVLDLLEDGLNNLYEAIS